MALNIRGKDLKKKWDSTSNDTPALVVNTPFTAPDI
jgi:hypothetical protein